MLDPVGALVARTGVTANQISFAGFALGLGAAVAVAFGAGTAAVLLIIANRLFDGLDGAVARSTGSTDLGAYLDITLDFLFYSAVPFAFAVAYPANATAAASSSSVSWAQGRVFWLCHHRAKARHFDRDKGKKGFFYRRLDRRQRDHHFLGRGLLARPVRAAGLGVRVPVLDHHRHKGAVRYRQIFRPLAGVAA